MIRQATIDDLPNLGALAEQFFASSRHLREFDLNTFVANWTQFITLGIGVVFLLEDDEKTPLGAIGGLAFPDVNCGKLAAQEAFWFVAPESRGAGGVRLLDAFERWACGKGCVEIRMVHLEDSMPEKLQRFYERRGYEKSETVYTKGGAAWQLEQQRPSLAA